MTELFVKYFPFAELCQTIALAWCVEEVFCEPPKVVDENFDSLDCDDMEKSVVVDPGNRQEEEQDHSRKNHIVNVEHRGYLVDEGTLLVAYYVQVLYPVHHVDEYHIEKNCWNQDLVPNGHVVAIVAHYSPHLIPGESASDVQNVYVRHVALGAGLVLVDHAL